MQASDDRSRVLASVQALYNRYGYRPYRMNKFEEYDLYARNKDFLISDRVITFTDLNGKLMALKPDVTLSIVKNSTDLPTANGAVAKNPDLVVLNFAGTEGDFQFATEQERAENVNIGVSVAKGNADLQKMLDDYLKTMTEADFNKIMNEAIGFQPEI